jgi:hypothetical protein
VFSYIDLVRLTIALDVEEQFGAAIADEEMDAWRTLGDVARSVVARASKATTEEQVFEWVRMRIVEVCGATELAGLDADGDVFSDYDRSTAWFMALAGARNGPRTGSTESRTSPYYCAYNAPSDLRALPQAWLTERVVSLARQMSVSLDFSALPILADALQEAGCDGSNMLHHTMLHHCRNPVATHTRGCWVVDLVLGAGWYQSVPGASPGSVG